MTIPIPVAPIDLPSATYPEAICGAFVVLLVFVLWAMWRETHSS